MGEAGKGETRIFSDKSIVEQGVCTINDGEKVFEGFSIVVQLPNPGGLSAVEVLLLKSEMEEALALLNER